MRKVAEGPSVKDPVCGMDVEPGHAGGGNAEHQGTTYWFCDPACRKKFVAEPARYLDSRLGPGGPDTRVYTCPMHPEVRQIGPGSCPKCGMALEPLEVTAADEGPSDEMVDMTRRFWVSLALTVHRDRAIAVQRGRPRLQLQPLHPHRSPPADHGVRGRRVPSGVDKHPLQP
jgi:YHS domain-containing protein